MRDLWWRIRCAYWFARLLGWGWLTRCWELASIQLDVERDHAMGDELPPPEEAVREELSCWSD